RRANGSWRCSRCRHTFATPEAELVHVTVYQARYDAAWTSLEGVLDAVELPALTDKPKSFNAIRELDWRRFSTALTERSAERAVVRLMTRSPDFWWRPDADVRVEFQQG